MSCATALKNFLRETNAVCKKNVVKETSRIPEVVNSCAELVGIPHIKYGNSRWTIKTDLIQRNGTVNAAGTILKFNRYVFD